ncbi:MAG: phage major capsid protein [Betaproteobacteria bacterium]
MKFHEKIMSRAISFALAAVAITIALPKAFGIGLLAYGESLTRDRAGCVNADVPVDFAALKRSTESAIESLRADLGKDLEKMTKQALFDVGNRQGGLENELSAVQQKLIKMSKYGNAGQGNFGGSGQFLGLGKCATDISAAMQSATNVQAILPVSIKALAAPITTDTLNPPPQNGGLVSGYRPPIERLINLLPSRPVTANSLTYIRVSYEVPDGNAAAVVAEGATKPRSSVVTVPVTLEMATFAHWLDASKQILADVTELQGLLDAILRGGLLDKVDLSVYATLTAIGNFTAFVPVAGEPLGDSVARIAAYIANVGGSNIIVALNPGDFLTMQLVKAAGGGTYLGLPANLASRVVAVPAVAAGKLLAFAPTSGVSWADREGVNVVVGLKNDDFVKNMVTVLCESRGETLVRDAAHVAYGNATA